MIAPADVAFFQTHGWFVTPPIVPVALLDRAMAGLVDHWAGHRDWPLPATAGYSDWMPGSGPGTRNNEYLSLQNGDVRALAAFPPIGDYAAALLQDSFVRLFDDQMVCKPPAATASAVGWHVDSDYWATCAAHEMITAWIPLDDCPIELGPLVVVDGSHRGPRPAPPGTLSFHKQDMSHADFATPDALVPMALKRGQVSFHHGRAVHGSYPNNGQRPRVAFALHMQSSRNRYRTALRPDGTPVRLFNDCLCSRDANGLPDYSDDRVFPRLGSGAAA